MKRVLLLALACVAACESTPFIGSPEPDPRVAFAGADALGAWDLFVVARPDLERYWASRRKTALDDARFRIGHRYGLEGYADAKVEVEAAGERILFTIEEGPQLVLGRVHFGGNTAFKSRELRSSMPGRFLGAQPAYSPRLVTLLEDHVRAKYHGKGYVDVALRVEPYRDDKNPQQMNMRVHVTEGRPYTVAEVRGAEGVKNLPDVTGRPYTPATPGLLEAAAEHQERNAGHPFARAQATAELDAETGRAVLTLEIERGPPARIGVVNIRGHERMRKGFVEQRADLEPGARYRVDDLRRAAERLRETRLFRLVQVAPGAYEELSGEVDVDIQVEERHAGEIAVRGGYGSLDGARGGAEAVHRNILGGAEYVRVSATGSRFGWRGDAGGGLPWFLGTEFMPEGGGYYEEREYESFEVASYGGSISLTHPIARKAPVTAGVRHAVIETKKVDPGVPPGDLLDFDYTALFVSASFDRRDSALLPTSGFYLAGTMEWSDEAFKSQIQFLRTGGRATAYLPLGSEVVLAGSVQSGLIVPIDDTNTIPISLRHFAGGTNTVRGYEFGTLGPKVGGEPTGGEAYFAMQGEIRFGIVGDLHGAAFADAGDVWFDHEDFRPEHGLRWAVGMGLRYHTPAGPIVADVAWNPHHHKHEDEDAVVFHLSIGFPF